MAAPLRADEPIGLDELSAFGDAVTGLAELTTKQTQEVPQQ